MKNIIKIFRLHILLLFSFLYSIKVHNSNLVRNIKNNKQDFEKKTTIPIQSIGNGDVFDLQYHDVECPKNSFIKNFKLTSKNNSNYFYEYTCQKSISIGVEVYETKSKIISTKKNDKFESIKSLTRFDIQCKDDYVLQRFKLNRFGDKIQYVYRCVTATCNHKFIKKSTNEIYVGQYALKDIKDLIVDLEINQAIMGFGLIDERDVVYHYFKYNIYFCFLKPDKAANSLIPQSNSIELQTKYTVPSDYGNGSILLLDKQEVACESGRVLTGFGLNTPESEKINYKYSCIFSNAVKQEITYSKKSKVIQINNYEFTAINKLIDLEVKCDNGYSLQRFKLEKSEASQDIKSIFYNFTCVKVDCNLHKSDKTYSMGVEDFSYIITSNLKVKLEPGKVLTGFKLNRDSRKDYEGFYYTYESCQLIENPNISNTSILPDKKEDKILLNFGETCFDATKEIKNKDCRPGLKCLSENPNIPDNLITLKKCLHSDPQIDNHLEKGNLFCQSNCVINENSENKKCWNEIVKSCKKCSIKPEIKDIEKAELCEAICNSILPNGQCKFYGYINKEKKDISQKILDKYGLNIVRRYK